jgi:hypothetical protein
VREIPPMAIHEYQVKLFLEIESDEEEDPLLVEEALTSLIEEEIHSHASTKATRCGLSFHDVNEVTVKKT